MSTTLTAQTTGSVQATPGGGPEQIMKIASGFMAAKHLFAASELGLFEALADSPADIGALAARTGLTVRAARISADAMVALEVLVREGDTYRNGPAAAQFLSGRTQADLRPFLRFWDKISYRTWTALAEALGSGPPTEIFELDDDLQTIASAGIEAVLAGPAAALPNVVDFVAARRLLDIGGGTGSWSIAAARACPTLQATVLDLPVVADLARARVTDAGLSDRIHVVVGDATSDDFPTGHDVFLVANLVHYWSPDENRVFLARVRRAAVAGARLLLADFWTDPGHTTPVHAALMAGEFAVHVRNGDVYSVEEVREWLAATGWQFTEHLALAGPQSLIVATAD
jgi:ubiquinone/menaquinone biosynthesis C-methylase UbiE